MKHYKNLDEFKYIVPMPEEYQEGGWSLHEWLMDIEKEDYIVLYNHYTTADGQWKSGPEYIALFVAFRKDEDAVAFKLKWI